jgi:hypothetical protein
MLLYIRIDERLKGQVDKLVESGKYDSFNSAALAALQNLVVAEEDSSSIASAIVKQESQAVAPAPTDTRKSTPPQTRTALPNFLILPKNLKFPQKLIAPFPADLFQHGQRVPIERWIFGQQNRVLPLKINARVFIRLILERGIEIELFEAAKEISKQAGEAYAFLNHLDEQNSHTKDESLTIGFPEPGSDKAASRYANHFAAYESTQGSLSGMLIQWKLAGVKRSKNITYLIPTKACVDFASLPNPILDAPSDGKVSQKFSLAEISWAIDHLARHVPVEASAFTAVLAGITSDKNSPDSLDKYLRETATDKKDISDEFISTQRSGAISRMADLNLLKRIRDGTKVSYGVTDSGKKWLQKNQK